MVNINFKNSTLKTSGSSSTKKQIFDFLKKIHARKQGFYEILDNTAEISKINKFAKSIEGKYKHIVVLGIGGSALGAICLKQSLTHLFNGASAKHGTPGLYILDNIDPILIKELEDVIDLPETLFIVITKSGTTTETMSQYFYFRKKTDLKKLDPKKHFVFITDPEKGHLREIANKENIPTFVIPENVGGRFSVLTAVGLLPAALIGINIQKLIIGAKSTSENLAFRLAKTQFELAKKGKTINVLMPYSQKLISLADWYKQLLAESIGKKHNNKGKIANVGITPISALGVTDQHSQLQLYNDGPNDKLIIFLEVENHGPKLPIPGQKFTFNQLIDAEKRATEDSLTKSKRPNVTIKIKEVNEETLGELFMLFECSIAFLGEFFEINAFDQPGVELSKKLTKKYLTDAPAF